MNNLNEQLLTAWLRLTTRIVNSRIVPDMTYNESLVCNILYNRHLEGGTPLTATHLCAMTGMLKSQMNRTLGSLEERQLILRERSTQDKRQVYVSMNVENCAEYIAQHGKILSVVGEMVERIGADRAQQAIELFTLISDNADSLTPTQNRKEN